MINGTTNTVAVASIKKYCRRDKLWGVDPIIRTDDIYYHAEGKVGKGEAFSHSVWINSNTKSVKTINGTTWYLVKYVPPATPSWYSTNDNLAGTQKIGNYFDETQEYSREFFRFSWTKMLFENQTTLSGV